MANNDTKLFYLSGLFSISFFLVIIFSALYYSYVKNKVLKVKTNNRISISIIDTPQSKIIPPKPKPKKVIPPKLQPKKPVEKPKEIVEPELAPPSPKAKTPSFGSLFSSVDTSKYSEEIEEVQQKPRISNETMNRLKSQISKTEIPVNNQKDSNFSNNLDYEFERSYDYKERQSIRVDYKELEITNSTLDDSEQGVYDKFYSQIKSFLYNNWYPSGNVAGNTAIVRIILNRNSILEHYKIVTRGKSEDFNIELTEYLESIKGTAVSVDIKTRVSFEVKFRAKE